MLNVSENAMPGKYIYIPYMFHKGISFATAPPEYDEKAEADYETNEIEVDSDARVMILFTIVVSF